MYVMHSSLKAHLHVPVGAIPEPSLEQLNPDDGEHEEQEDSDQHNVSDGFHCHDDALDHMLQSFGSINSSRELILLANIFYINCTSMDGVL